MTLRTAKKTTISESSYPSTLVTEVTKAQLSSPPTYGQTLRHSCYPEFLAAWQTYASLDEFYPRHRDQKIRDCRNVAWFVRHRDTGEVKVASSSCKLRWCPVCARAKRSYIAHNLEEWLEDSDHPKFLTLTLKHSNAPLEHQINCLYGYFKSLRRRKEFRKIVTGGVWFFHIKKSKDDGLWHPHLHCIITGLYFPKSLLKRLWVQLTFNSFVVGIRVIRDYDHASFEAARYAACPGQLHGLSLTDRIELVEAMHGRRICGTWGTGRAVALRPLPPEDKFEWVGIGGFQAVFGDRKSDRNADAIFHAWKSGHPLPEDITYLPEDRFMNNIEPFSWKDYDIESPAEVERSPP